MIVDILWWYDGVKMSSGSREITATNMDNHLIDIFANDNDSDSDIHLLCVLSP